MCVFYSDAAREALAIWCPGRSAAATASAFTRVFDPPSARHAVFDALWQGPKHKIAKTTPCKVRNPLQSKRELLARDTPESYA